MAMYQCPKTAPTNMDQMDHQFEFEEFKASQSFDQT